MVIEESFDKKNHKKWNPKYGYGIQMKHGLKDAWVRKWINVLSRDMRKDYVFPKCDTVLLKLHGSLNWRVNKYNKRIILKDYPFHVMTSKGRHPRPENVSIIPPSILKDITDDPYSQIWHNARKSLENCQRIIIAGYSLPETDFIAHSLFNEVVRSRLSKNKPNLLRELHLADPNKEVIDKFITIFTPVLGPRGRIYKYRSFNDLCNILKR